MLVVIDEGAGFCFGVKRAVELVENVIAHKADNNIRSLDRFHSENYEKMLLSLDKFDVDFRDPSWRDFRFLEQYVDTVCDIIEALPPEVTIHRLTGDAPQDRLIAPEWTRNKHHVLNAIQQEFSRRGTYQGIKAQNMV